MKGWTITLHRKCFQRSRFKQHMIPLVICIFLIVQIILRPPTCMETTSRVKAELESLNLPQSCQILETDNEQECGFQRQWDKMKTRTCDHIQKELADLPTLPEEAETPLAFSILVHRDIDQLQELLTAIYRPHNSYCIQIDAKSPKSYFNEVQDLISCYSEKNQNIFLSNRNISLVWQHSSLLEGDLFCLEQLLSFSQDWQYYVNIVGSEYPVETNLHLVRKLKAVENPIGFVQTIFPHLEVTERWRWKHILKNSENEQGTSFLGGYYKNVPIRTGDAKGPPPHNLTVMYGIKNAAITRSFGEFCIFSQIAKDLRLWLSDALVAVEHFYPTLAIVDQTTGLQDFSFIQSLNSFEMRHTFWYPDNSCYGEVKREICVLSLRDLPKIVQLKSTFIVNKFDSEVDPSIVPCLKEILTEKRLSEFGIFNVLI